ncbi:MAG: hypothetical protein AAF958_01445 [Planctomycetota bacterium]
MLQIFKPRLSAAAPPIPTFEATDDDVRIQLTAAGRCELIANGIPGIEPEPDEPIPFRMFAYSGGIMYPLLSGVDWNGPVVVDISGMDVEFETPIHRSHDQDRPVGHGYAEAGRDIVIDGMFSIENDDSREIISGLRRGFPWRASIGLSRMGLERVAAGRSVRVNGRDFDGPILVIRSSHLDESSFVTVPGDMDTAAFLANRGGGTHPITQTSDGTAVTFSQWLAANNHDEATLQAGRAQILFAEYRAWTRTHTATQSKATAAATDAALTGCGAGTVTSPPAVDPTPAAVDPGTTTPDPNTPTGDPTPTTPSASPAGDTGTGVSVQARSGQQSHHVVPDGLASLAARREAAAAEEERIEAIREIGNSIANPEMEGGGRLVAHAIRGEWTVEQTRLFAQQARRPSAPAIHTSSRSDRESVGAIQAAMMLRAGRPIDMVLPQSPSVPVWMTRPVNDNGRDQIMTAAQDMRNATTMEFVELALRASGHDVPSGYGVSHRHAILRAGFSTGAIAAVFDQSIGSIALTAYREAQDFTQGWTSEADALNLLPHERPRLIAAQDLTIHPTGGQADHAHRTANSETVKVDRFSRQAKMDENDFINDQFGLLADTPRDFGFAAARLRPALVASILLKNPTLKRTGAALFNTAGGTLINNEPLTRAGLSTARAKLAQMKDGDAVLNLPATHLITGSELADTAIQLTQSAVLTQDGGGGSQNPIFRRDITPVEEARLDLGMIDPTSDPENPTNLTGNAAAWYLASANGKGIEVQFLAGTGRMPVVMVEPLSGDGEFGVCVVVKHFAGAAAVGEKSIVMVDGTPE